MDVVFVGHRCCDHSPSSGYDQVCSLFPEAGFLDGRALEAGRMEWHRKPRASGEANLRLFHVIYGDCSGKVLPSVLRQRFPGAGIVSSAHQPVSRLQADAPALAALGDSDAIVAVSDWQAQELEGLGFSAPIYAVPHGVWTKAFRPTSPSPPDRKDVLFVGSFLRDWEGAKEVARALARAGVRSLGLGAGAREHLGGGDSPIEVLPRIAEEELAALYHGASAVFLPFLEATASNALLEAMAAGCPVVCPRLPPLVDEYLGDDSDSFEPGGYDAAASRLLGYVRGPLDRDARGRELMARAERFDWSRLRGRYEAVYEEVAARAAVPERP